jgi:hypothetical protein
MGKRKDEMKVRPNLPRKRAVIDEVTKSLTTGGTSMTEHLVSRTEKTNAGAKGQGVQKELVPSFSVPR